MSNKTLEQFSKAVEALQEAKAQKTEVEAFGENLFKNHGVNGSTIDAAIDYAAGNSSVWMERFNSAFKKELGVDVEAVRKLSGDETKAVEETIKEKFSITASSSGDANIGGIIQTNIVGAMDAIFQKTSILSKVQVFNDTDSYQLPEFGAEQEAERSNENVSPNPKNDVPRNGDTLTAKNTNNKIKVSEEVSDLALRSMKPEDYGILRARLVRKMNRKIEREILLGTNASGQFAGFINATTGASAFGALASTLPLSGVAGGVQDDVDALKYLISSLPSEIDDADLAKYTLILNRATKWRIKRERDAEGRTYDVAAETDNIDMYTSFCMANNRVLLADLSMYYVLLAKPLSIEVRELDNEMYEVKSFTYADGGMRMGYKTLPDGTTENTDKNAHRYIDLKSDYSA